MTWTPRSDWFNVKDCVGKYPNFSGKVNAVGDGKTDDTAAIQSALSYIGPRPGEGSPWGHFQTIYFPPGTYKISSTLKLYFAKRAELVGSGNGTVLLWAGPKGGAMFNPLDAMDMIYRGLVWDGNNLAGCGVLQCSILDSNYDGNIRHENESFRNFTQAGTYEPLGQYGNPKPGEVPGAGIAGGFNGLRGDSLEADSMIVNCRFSNCTDGFFNAWAWGNQTEWTIDGCEFDGCPGIAVDFHAGGSNTVIDSHFENNGTDVSASANVHLRRCTSKNSGQFYSEWQGSYAQDVISDCWIDGWKNKDAAIALQDEGGHMVFDCTFTHAPQGSKGAIINREIWQQTTDQMLLSNNHATDFPPDLGLINPASNKISPLLIPPGARTGNIKSVDETFLDSSDYSDHGHIIDVTAAPYNADRSGGVDVTAALQAAIDAAKAANNGSIVYLPSGSYLVKAPLNLAGGNYSLEGSVNTAIWYWEPTGSALNVALSGVGPITINSLFIGHGGPASIVHVTATGASNRLVLKELISNLAGAGNPWVGAPDLDSKGIVFDNLPAGTQVFLDHVSSSINAQNCGAAEITGRFLQNGEINVSGTGAKTGCIGFVSNEGEAIPGSPEYAVNVSDNQNLTIEGWYDENNGAPVNDYHLTGGASPPGKVVIQGFNHFSAGAAQDLKIENFSGLFFLGPQSTLCGGGPLFTQEGSDPVTVMLTSIDFGAQPTFKFGPQCTALVVNNHTQRGGDFGAYVPNTPATLTAENLHSFALALDQLRQLGAVELRNRFHFDCGTSPVSSQVTGQNR